MLRLERWTEPLAESNCYLLGEAGRAVVIDPNDPRAVSYTHLTLPTNSLV